ncbi:MAG TPA: hypothetical protein VJB11_00685 [archaeon]|nr:hypothetical protein [archaeon]
MKKTNKKSLEEARKRNHEGNMKYIEQYVEWLKKTPNSVWSKQQAEFIDSVMKSANMDKELYMKIKGMKK